MHKTPSLCVFTVIFPGNIPYLKDYFDALRAQTDPDFHVWVVNDGVTDHALLESITKGLNISIHDYSNTPVLIRKWAFEALKNTSFDYVLFSDSDDTMTENRVEVSKKYLSSNEIVCNDVDIMLHDGTIAQYHLWEDRIENGKILQQSDIYQHNFLGLGNTAIRTYLFNDIHFEEDVAILDWYIFTNLLTKFSAVFTSETRSIYRQHVSNELGLSKYSIPKLFSDLKLLKEHYRRLSIDYNWAMDNYTKNVDIHPDQLDQKRLIDLISLINSENFPYFWFEQITLLLKLYHENSTNTQQRGF